MNRALLLILAILAVSIGFCRAQWSVCSRTCGWGTKHRTCTTADYPPCLVRYDDCKLRDCPYATCNHPNTFKKDSASECCRKADGNLCGVAQMKAIARRVIGGKKSEEGEWPWMAALWQKSPKKYFCGGVLVNEKWVVTAAHCFEDNGFTANDVMVRLGGNKQYGPNLYIQETNVAEYIKYSTVFNGWNDDIALLKLQTPMRYSSHVHPICMPNSEEPDQDTICYAAGWGFASLADAQLRRTSNDLLHVGLRIVPLDACKQTYRNQASFIGVTDKTLCVGIFAGGKDTCGGDSGSPLVCQRKNSCQWYFAGIVAFGATHCAAKYSPAVYTNVKVYESWILDRIHPCQDEKPCMNNGICVRLGMEYRCDCRDGFTGVHCEIASHPCDRAPCQNGGLCYRSGNDYVCSCPSQFEGKNCENFASHPCDRYPCLNGGLCYRSGNDYVCSCHSQFEGRNCENLVSLCRANERLRYGSTTSCCNAASTETCGIDNPSTTSEKIWPWLASLVLRRTGTVTCAGTLIHKDWVLTAAHCFGLDKPNDMRILLGTSTIKTPASVHQSFDIASTIIHESYNFPQNDIVVVKLSKSANINNFVRPICLPSLEKTDEGATCLVAGYEFPLTHGVAPDKVTENFMDVLGFDTCTKAYKAINDAAWTNFDQNSHLCVGKRDGTSRNFLCLPYLAGSPMMCQRCSSCGWYLVGLSEFGSSTQCTLAPDIYTNAYYFEGWIRQKISLPRTSTFSCP